MNFGKAIVLSFVLFALFIGVLVTVCVRQDVSLVSRDYYQQELDYQQKLNKPNNAGDLKTPPEITANAGHVSVIFGETSVEGGELKLLRPSDARLDRRFSLAPAIGKQEFDAATWQPGVYRASLTWTSDGKDYVLEKTIVF